MIENFIFFLIGSIIPIAPVAIVTAFLCDDKDAVVCIAFAAALLSALILTLLAEKRTRQNTTNGTKNRR